MRVPISAFLGFLAFVICVPAFAAPRYICGTRVQSVPCGQVDPAHRVMRNPDGSARYSARLGKVRDNPTLQATARRTPKLPSFAKVLVKSFKPLPSHEGLWSGRIEGNGVVHLRLVIQRLGVIESTRYMGNVRLQNKSSSFAFKSMQPAGKNWSWDIVAYNG